VIDSWNAASFAALLERRVREVVAESYADTHAAELVNTITAYLSRPARYVRPRLVYAAAHAYRGADGGAATANDGASAVDRLAVATEMFHVFALLHDDRIDTPRGVGEFSPETALLAGDLLFAAGYGLIAETVEHYRLPREILLQVRRIASRTVVGQAADVTFRRTHGDRPQRADLYHLYDLKTGLYTIAAPLQIGALASGADPGEIERLQEVALPLGRAFQMRDDLLDITAAATGAQTAAESIPPWELNLAVTYTNERDRGGLISPEPGGSPPDSSDEAFLVALDLPGLAEFVSVQVDELLREAVGAVARLHLSSDQRTRLLSDLEDTLTSLTFPSPEANTVFSAYGPQ